MTTGESKRVETVLELAEAVTECRTTYSKTLHELAKEILMLDTWWLLQRSPKSYNNSILYTRFTGPVIKVSNFSTIVSGYDINVHCTGDDNLIKVIVTTSQVDAFIRSHNLKVLELSLFR